MHRAVLVAHPDAADGGVRRIEASVSRSGGVLAVTYRLDGDLDRLRIPAWGGRQAGERLWEHTCFEMFIRKVESDPTYHELNFSPSGAWAACAFAHYRQGSPLADSALDPRIITRRRDGTLEVKASIVLGRLSPEYLRAPLALALSAVIEDGEGGLSYWALVHPAGKPDFHHRDGFVLKMDPGSDPG